MSNSLSTKYKVYTGSNLPKDLLVSYKGSSFDSGSFYCPYVPLGITGPTYPGSIQHRIAPDRIMMEIRENQGGHFDAVGVFTINGGRMAPKNVMEDIAVWCIDHWGAPGLAAPALWKMDRELIFVHDPRILVEIKLHWHGTTP
ncbi:MAG: hypothetical protein EOO77_20100 [Oxalobacteraceae bacterium]|nr:MAG: hypothetical protein EOO77_20100 [Oxalobacteraceae bacterium]